MKSQLIPMNEKNNGGKDSKLIHEIKHEKLNISNGKELEIKGISNEIGNYD